MVSRKKMKGKDPLPAPGETQPFTGAWDDPPNYSGSRQRTTSPVQH